MSDVVQSPIGPPRTAALGRLDSIRLEAMLAAGDEVRECYRVLDRAGLTLVGEVIKGQGAFTELEHYPKGDVYDTEYGSQYYYHAHRDDAEEHGHFHTFVRAPAMPEEVAPVVNTGRVPWPSGDDALSHLVCISMDARGHPIALFATNRWVTSEAWYRAADVIDMVDRFRIDHARPSWPVNRWLTAMMCLFKPQIAALLEHRDAVVDAWTVSHPGVDVYEDRELEITGWLPICVDDQMAAVRASLKAGR